MTPEDVFTCVKIALTFALEQISDSWSHTQERATF